MMTKTCAVIFISLVSLAVGQYPFKATTCDGVSGSAFQFSEVKVKTDPIDVPGVIETSFKVTVTKTPTPGVDYDIVFDLRKSDAFQTFSIGLQCKDGFGSCNFDFCDYVPKISFGPGSACHNKACTCADLKPGVYEVPSLKMTVTKGQLSKQPFSGYFIYGTYVRSSVKIVRRDTKEVMGCVQLQLTLNKPSSA